MATRFDECVQAGASRQFPQPDLAHASMPHPRVFTPSILFLMAVTRSPVAGQNIPSPYAPVEHSQAFAVFAGKSDLNPGRLGLGPQNATTAGGQYTVAFGPMNLDVDGTLFMSTRDVLDVSRPVDDRSLGTTDIDIFLFDLRLRLNLTGPRAWHGLQPFIAFGGGAGFPVSTDRRLETNAEMPPDEWYEFGRSFIGTLAGGANFHVHDRVSIRVEGVMNLWKIATPAGWKTVAADPLSENPESEWVAARTIRVGLAWRF